MTTMTNAQRLQGICEMIAEQRKEDDPETTTTWRVENDWQAVIDIGTTRAIISWIRSGPWVGQIEVEFSGDSTTQPGAVQLMYINAAMWPQGDFQVAETIGDQL